MSESTVSGAGMGGNPVDLAALAPGTVFRDREDGPEMVRVPAASFQMGSPDSGRGHCKAEGPVHTVAISYPLAVGRYPVTRGLWRCYLERTGRAGSGNSWGWSFTGKKWEQRPEYSWCSPGFPQDDTHPVVCVTWEEAEAYAQWLGAQTGQSYRLLSEAEWEYAARGGTSTAYYWGDDIGQDNAHHWDCQFDTKGTVPVGGFPANPFGLHDMVGNVWTWTRDCWNPDYQGAPSDGSAWTSGDCGGRVARGGSWYNDPRVWRCANRGFFTHSDYGRGLRLART